MISILIAEDDVISRKLLCKVLSEHGECDHAANGIEAIDSFILALKRKKPYDLICLDIMMPKLDGITVLKAMRDLEVQYKLEKRAKIIMTTALSETELVEEAFNKGSDAYATKPIDIDKLLEVIKNFGFAE